MDLPTDNGNLLLSSALTIVWTQYSQCNEIVKEKQKAATVIYTRINPLINKVTVDKMKYVQVYIHLNYS